MKLLYGLGNPDEENAHSRHNAGWMLLDRYKARSEESQPWSVDRDGEFALCVVGTGDSETALCKPTRYMNDQGFCLKNAIGKLCVDPSSDVLVLHDDLDLSLGALRLRQKGSPPSHNGLASIHEHLRTDLFWRLRIGIESRKSRKEIKGEDFVLGDFCPQEMAILEEAFGKSISAIRHFVSGKIQQAVNCLKR